MGRLPQPSPDVAAAQLLHRALESYVFLYTLKHCACKYLPF